MMWNYQDNDTFIEFQSHDVLSSFDAMFEIIKKDSVNTLRPRQNGRHFADDILKRIFLNENIWIPIKISLKFVPKGSINDIPALVQIMAWHRPGDKPLSEPMMVNLPTHICVTRPRWVNEESTNTGVTCIWCADGIWKDADPLSLTL